MANKLIKASKKLVDPKALNKLSLKDKSDICDQIREVANELFEKCEGETRMEIQCEKETQREASKIFVWGIRLSLHKGSFKPNLILVIDSA